MPAELGTNVVAVLLSRKGDRKPPVAGSWMKDLCGRRWQAGGLNDPPDVDERNFQGIEVVTLDRQHVNHVNAALARVAHYLRAASARHFFGASDRPPASFGRAGGRFVDPKMLSHGRGLLIERTMTS